MLQCKERVGVEKEGLWLSLGMEILEIICKMNRYSTSHLRRQSLQFLLRDGCGCATSRAWCLGLCSIPQCHSNLILNKLPPKPSAKLCCQAQQERPSNI